MHHTTVGSILRSSQAFHAQICERQTLDYGIAYYNADLASLPEANQFREVVIPDGSAIPAAYAYAEAFFAEQPAICMRWAPAEGDALPGLAGFLAARGFEERIYKVMRLTRWPARERFPEVRILPARAMRAAFRATFKPDPASDAGIRAEVEARRDAYIERLDDASLDMSVALCDGEPAGRCALYQVGDIARVMDLFVVPVFRRRDVETALLDHVLALARRVQTATICVQVEPERSERMAVYAAAGFEPDGQIVEYHRTAGVTDRPAPVSDTHRP